MSYSTQQDILDFVEDNNVKFVRFAFCDIFGTQKNIAVLASDLPKALEDGVCFDGSSIAGFHEGGGKRSCAAAGPVHRDHPALAAHRGPGDAVLLRCGKAGRRSPLAATAAAFCAAMNRKFKKLGLTCNVGAECEFYLFENDDRGRPTRIPIDFGGYFDVAPLDAGENLRRDICLTMEQMGHEPSSTATTRAATARTRSTATMQAPSRPPTT